MSLFDVLNDVSRESFFVGKSALVVDYITSASGFGNVPYVMEKLPNWGFANSIFGIAQTVTGLLKDAEEIKSASAASKVERGVLDLLAILSNIQLLTQSLDAKATGSVVPVFYGYAITCGISFATNFYRYAKAEFAIKQFCDTNRLYSRDLLLNPKAYSEGSFKKIKQAQDLLNERDKYLHAMAADGLNCIGFSYLTVGNPVGYVFLGLTTFRSLQQTFAPNMFNRFFSGAEKGNSPNRASGNSRSPSFSLGSE
jgi:hypothetical protein